MIWFTSDEHYGHQNIIKFCHRPFSTLSEMHETMIARHNSKVQKGDICIHLGDMFWRSLTLLECLSILGRLNGQHCYVWGNHEENMQKHESLRKKFGWVKESYQLKTSKFPMIYLHHFAHRSWPSSHRGSYHLYGHTHNVLPAFGNSFDAGVDAQNFFPISIEEVDKRMKEMQKITKVWVCECGHSFLDNLLEKAICAKCGKDMIVEGAQG